MTDYSPLQRWEELLADRTGGCLPHEERRELDRLLVDRPDVDPYDFDEAAGVMMLALAPPTNEAVPSSVAHRLQASADAWFAGQPAPPLVRDVQAAPRGRLLSSPWSGWVAAAALALILAGPKMLSSSGADALDPSSDRIALLEQDGIGYWEFSATDDPLAGNAGGDVVWSTEEQRGYMTFRGLAPNDPTKNQYQLWIFDGSRTSADSDEAVPPVDGGVFDVSADGEVIVPIDPKLLVAQPTLFAITMEEPGGVVVSKQEHVLLVASTSS